MIQDWRLTFVNSAPDAPFLVNELGAMQVTSTYKDPSLQLRVDP